MSKRLLKELSNLSKSPSPACEWLGPINEQNLFKWIAILKGPPATPYEHGTWKVIIDIPEAYPLEPPKMHFDTRICHPNIDLKTGEVCIDVLKSQWTPAWGIASAILAVQAMLSDPEPDSPLNVDAANLVRSGEKLGYRQLVGYYIEVEKRRAGDRPV